MKTQSDLSPTDNSKNLHKLIGLVAGNTIAAAVQRNNFIVNDVPASFEIATDQNNLAIILDSLLSTVVSNTQHSCIRIEAKEYEDMMFVVVRDNSGFSNYDIDGNLKQVKLLAKNLNGTVTITNKEEKSTSILLSFPNFPKVA
ncbi:MAG: hypothetical protein ABIN01_06425 [Ferruginibacter sp.]